jgi:hypothetical protein
MISATSLLTVARHDSGSIREASNQALYYHYHNLSNWFPIAADEYCKVKQIRKSTLDFVNAKARRFISGDGEYVE